jgi:hypothetical protein
MWKGKINILMLWSAPGLQEAGEINMLRSLVNKALLPMGCRIGAAPERSAGTADSRNK